jgi:exocyst complex component 3
MACHLSIFQGTRRCYKKEICDLSRFKRDFEGFVSPNYLAQSNKELEAIGDGYVDLGTYFISAFVSLIFAVDFRSTLSEFFTPKWYSEYGMKRITSTFHPLLMTILATILRSSTTACSISSSKSSLTLC